MNKKILLLITFLISILFVAFLFVFTSEGTEEINKKIESNFDKSGKVINEINLDGKLVTEDLLLEPKNISIPEFIEKNKKMNKTLTMNFYINDIQINKISLFTVLLKNNSEKEFRTSFNPSCQSVVTMHFYQNGVKASTSAPKCDSKTKEKEFIIPADEIAVLSFEKKIKLKPGKAIIILETKEIIQEYTINVK
jgi:hypothetical protein